MTKTTAKKLFKIIFLLYLASFLVINWNDVSWVFNYKTVSGLVEDFFNPYPSIDAMAMDAYFYPNHSAVKNISTQNIVSQTPAIEAKTNYTDKQNTLEIPSISLITPIVFSNSAEKNSIMCDLNSGVVYYPGSVYPGQQGQIIILGHSSPPGWPKIKHDWVFTNIEKLVPGDKIFIDLNNKQYTYIVKEQNIIKKGAEVPTSNLSANNSILTLISCWPPGKDYQRIAVIAELVID